MSAAVNDCCCERLADDDDGRWQHGKASTCSDDWGSVRAFCCHSVCACHSSPGFRRACHACRDVWIRSMRCCFTRARLPRPRHGPPPQRPQDTRTCMECRCRPIGSTNAADGEARSTPIPQAATAAHPALHSHRRGHGRGSGRLLSAADCCAPAQHTARVALAAAQHGVQHVDCGPLRP